MTCDYFGCGEPIREDDVKAKAEGRYSEHTNLYCETHGAEFDKLVEDHNIPGMVSWWVKAGGGAERMARTS